MYITNLENGLQMDGTELNDEIGPNEKKPVAYNRPTEMPSLNNLKYEIDFYGETGNDPEHIEDFPKGKNKKNSKEHKYTKRDKKKEGKRADLLKSKTTRYHHDIPRNKGENEKALVTKEMGLNYLEKNIFIGDSAATSHMTNRKLGVYDLVPINGSGMTGNGKSISCTHKGKMDVICKHKDGSLARETWEVKIVPEGNRHWLIVVDEFSDCVHSFFLNKKSDQIKILPMWIKGIAKKHRIEIKRIRLDNSGENKSLQKECDKQNLGIIFEVTVPGTPQQNSIAERRIPALMGRARAMLIQAGLEPKHKGELWCEVISTATKLDNIMVRPERTKPPYTLFYGEDAKYAQSLRIFGEMAVIAIHEGRKMRSKLDDRGKTCMFVDMLKIMQKMCIDS